jgi:Glucose / Sorbosone dehydrogenase
MSAVSRAIALLALLGSPATCQTSGDPFPKPIAENGGAITVNYREFAHIPDLDGSAARMMIAVVEPGTRRLFVNDMRGPIYRVSEDGRTVTPYVNINDPQWGFSVQSSGRERGFQSMAFHPRFGEAGSPGCGKFYTWSDTDNTNPTPDFRPKGGETAHHTVLLEWTARNPSAATYDGGLPRELARFQQPFGNHNGGQLGFNPLVSPGDSDFGMLYVGVADGGSGGDPMNQAQDLRSGFGKLFRIDPLGRNSANGKYGVPTDNPFASDGDDGTLGEIYAYGLRNPQRFAWDPQTGTMFLSDIGQNTVEEISVVTRGANLGWNVWEGSFRYSGRSGVDLAHQRGDTKVTFPVAEYGQIDPLLQGQSAATGLVVYRANAIPQLSNKVLWGDNPSGEVFYFSADDVPNGGQDVVRRVLFNDDGQTKTLLQLIQDKNAEQGKSAASRADLRISLGPAGEVLLLNKSDGTIRMLVP